MKQNISMSLKLLSVNCQGLGDINKRRDVFDYLRKFNYNIYCLQDTHFTVDTENAIRNLWGYDCYFSSYTSNARSVAILFKILSYGKREILMVTTYYWNLLLKTKNY